jgi:hypothetical protein
VAQHAHLAPRGKLAQARHMTVKLGGEEAHPAHLAVGDDVNPGVFLVAQGHIYRVVLRLDHVLRPVLAALRRL